MSGPKRRKRTDRGDVDPTPMEIVGNRIRVLRMSHGMTQHDLARRCFVHQVTVSKWEQGACIPTWFGKPSRRELIAAALNLPVSFVFAEVIKAESTAHGQAVA